MLSGINVFPSYIASFTGIHTYSLLLPSFSTTPSLCLFSPVTSDILNPSGKLTVYPTCTSSPVTSSICLLLSIYVLLSVYVCPICACPNAIAVAVFSLLVISPFLSVTSTLILYTAPSFTSVITAGSLYLLDVLINLYSSSFIVL